MVKRILALLVGVGILVGAIVFAALNAPEEEPTTPSPQVTITAAPAPAPPDSGPADDHEHHIPDGLEDSATCELDTGECDGQIQELDGVDTTAWEQRVREVVIEHLRVVPGEDTAARAARVEAAGAAAELAHTTPRVARADTGKPGLSARTSVRDVVSVMAVTVDESGLRYMVGLNVSASYRLPSGQGTDYILAGRVDVWVNQSEGLVTRIAEHFPALDRMR